MIPIYHFVVGLSRRLGRQLVLWRNGPAGLAAPPGDVAAARTGRRTTGRVRDGYLLGPAIGFLVVLALLVRGISMLDLDQRPAGFLLSILMPLYWLVGTAFLYQLVDPLIRFVVGRHATRPGSMTRAAMGFPVISLVLKFAVIALGFSEVLELFSFDVTTVLAGLGIGGLAFALAAQDTLKNFFGSIMLIWDRTFRVGDRVRIGATRA